MHQNFHCPRWPFPRCWPVVRQWRAYRHPRNLDLAGSNCPVRITPPSVVAIRTPRVRPAVGVTRWRECRPERHHRASPAADEHISPRYAIHAAAAPGGDPTGCRTASSAFAGLRPSAATPIGTRTAASPRLPPPRAGAGGEDSTNRLDTVRRADRRSAPGTAESRVVVELTAADRDAVPGADDGAGSWACPAPPGRRCHLWRTSTRHGALLVAHPQDGPPEDEDRDQTGRG
jgi:hypothetical protein